MWVNRVLKVLVAMLLMGGVTVGVTAPVAYAAGGTTITTTPPRGAQKRLVTVCVQWTKGRCTRTARRWV